jgi:hypothetical protein
MFSKFARGYLVEHINYIRSTRPAGPSTGRARAPTAPPSPRQTASRGSTSSAAPAPRREGAPTAPPPTRPGPRRAPCPSAPRATTSRAVRARAPTPSDRLPSPAWSWAGDGGRGAALPSPELPFRRQHGSGGLLAAMRGSFRSDPRAAVGWAFVGMGRSRLAEARSRGEVARVADRAIIEQRERMRCVIIDGAFVGRRDSRLCGIFEVPSWSRLPELLETSMRQRDVERMRVGWNRRIA